MIRFWIWKKIKNRMYMELIVSVWTHQYGCFHYCTVVCMFLHTHNASFVLYNLCRLPLNSCVCVCVCVCVCTALLWQKTLTASPLGSLSLGCWRFIINKHPQQLLVQNAASSPVTMTSLHNDTTLSESVKHRHHPSVLLSVWLLLSCSSRNSSVWHNSSLENTID